jgi:3-deoxy-D-manno-octulosonic-acid transferase
MAVSPILKEYREMRPDDEIVLSVITPGGWEVGEGMRGKLVDRVFYAPFDAPFAVKRSVRVVRPDVFVNLETELWPNLLHYVNRSGAGLLLVNGRISDRSIRSYRRLKGLFRWVLGQFDRVLAQTETDAKRLVEIGAPGDRVEVFGNAKFDQAADRLSAEEIAELRSDLKLAENAPVLVIGSTRQVDEERLVVKAYLEARRSIPNLALIHAPRHVERAGEVMEILREAGLKPIRRTELAGVERAEQVVLDTFGELGRVYALADVAFIGNSLTPPGGGQNPLQPLAQGKPVIYGPYMQNFRDIAAMAESAGVATKVGSPEELAKLILLLVQDANREEIARRAVALVQENRGAARRYAEAIAELAASSGQPREAV